jgi:hypothetical protein
MPWKSKQQQKWGHSSAGQKALGGKGNVAEWDSATNFSSLPKKVKPGDDEQQHPFLKRELYDNSGS